MRRAFATSWLALVCGACSVEPPEFLEEDTILLASDGAADDWSGYAVAVSADGSRALVGAPRDDTAFGVDAGSARVFVRVGDGWDEEATLLPSTGFENARFGQAVAISGDGTRALLGIQYVSATVFLRTGTTWTEETALMDADGPGTDSFAYSVALSADGSRALVGAPSAHAGGTASDSGTVVVFARTGTAWAQEAVLAGSDRGVNDLFGDEVALSADGDRALVSAAWDDTAAASDAGSVRIFARAGTTWTEEAVLLPSGSTGQYFGSSAALSADGTLAVVGHPLEPLGPGMGTGSVRIFARAGTLWTEEAPVHVSDRADGLAFGGPVAVSANGARFVAGAYAWEEGRKTIRSFARVGSGWVEDAVLDASDQVAGDEFAWDLALSGDGGVALVGAFQDDTAGGTDAGSAYVFLLGR